MNRYGCLWESVLTGLWFCLFFLCWRWVWSNYARTLLKSDSSSQLWVANETVRRHMVSCRMLFNSPKDIITQNKSVDGERFWQSERIRRRFYRMCRLVRVSFVAALLLLMSNINDDPEIYSQNSNLWFKCRRSYGFQLLASKGMVRETVSFMLDYWCLRSRATDCLLLPFRLLWQLSGSVSSFALSIWSMCWLGFIYI
jgi:hypothetical protein